MATTDVSLEAIRAAGWWISKAGRYTIPMSRDTKLEVRAYARGYHAALVAMGVATTFVPESLRSEQWR